MIRSFLLRIWNGYKEYIVLVLMLLISLTLISVSNKPPLKKVKTAAFGTFAVLTSGFSKVLEPFTAGFEVEQLRETNANLMLQVNRLREYGIQNEELRRMLALKDTSDYQLISASIVSKHVAASQGIFIINAGRELNLREGMPVITDQGLVGIIHAVGNDFSVVRTIMNRDLKVAVKNQRSRYDGILEWDGNELIIKNVPKTFDMEVGDRIVTSDFSTKFPPAIPVGIVSGGNRNKAGIFNDITIKPFADLVRIDNVFIIAIVPSKQINDLELNLIK